jgi:putative ABC transport system ATP-binding protein
LTDVFSERTVRVPTGSMRAPVLPVYRCRELVKRRDAEGAGFELRVPSLDIRAGEIVVLQGESGCGKSTLLDMLALALRPDQATRFGFRPGNHDDADIQSLWQRGDLNGLGALRGRHIGYVLQTGGLLSFLTARENIALSCRLLGETTAGIEPLAERLGIAGQLDKRPGQLSVGERQRVAIARALAHRPRVLLADEPTASVDPLNAAVILELLMDLVRRAGVTAVIASHDWRPGEGDGVTVLKHRLERQGSRTRSLFWN